MNAWITGTGAALSDGQRVDAAARRVRPDPERRPQDCVVAVDEAEKVVCARVDVSDAGRNPASQVLLDAAAERPGPRQFQVTVRHLDVRQERRRPRSVDLLVDGGDRTKRPRAAAAEECLLERAVGRPVLGENEHRDTGDVRSGVGAHHGAAVAGQVPRQPEAGLQVVQVIRNPAVGRKHRILQIRSEEGFGRLDEDVRVPCAVPAQPDVQGDPFVGMPRVLNEHAQLVHRELLASKLLRGDAGDGRRLQVEQDRTGDGGSGRTGPVQAGRSVRAGDVALAVRDETDEALDRIEQVAAVRHPDELLPDAGPVVLHSGLDEVCARGERDVVYYLKPRVERRIDRKKERQPDAEAVGEVHADVGKRPAAQLGELGRTGQARAGEQRSLVPARPVLARHLHAQFVREGVGQ